jgi:hypothetical protein
MDKNVNRILQDLAAKASAAADDARAAARSAGKAVSGRYGAVKTTLGEARLHSAQEEVFCDIGRMMFMMHTGAVRDTVSTADGEKAPRQVVDHLLIQAEQLQQEIDALEEKRTQAHATSGEKVCPWCGRLCGSHDSFCAVCGEKLPEA